MECAVMIHKPLLQLMTESKSGTCTLVVIAEHLSVRLIIVQARRALVGPQSEVVLVCLFVCLSVTGLRLKYMYTGLCIVYVPFGMAAVRMPLRDGAWH